MFTGRFIQRLLLLASVVLFLAGCAGLVQERKEFRTGWRDATVKQLASGDQLAEPWRQSECVGQLSPAELTQTRVAVLTYRGVRIPKTRVIRVEPAAPWHPGDLVRVNVLDCQAPVQARS